MMRWNQLAGLWLMGLLGAQELPPVSGLPHPVVLRRIPAEDGWDLVVALSAAKPCGQAPRPCWWNTKDRLAILLQNRGDTNRVLPLAIEPGPNDDCSTRVERFTLQELVLRCVGEKSQTYGNQKFTYDVHARKLVGHFSYDPFSAERVMPGPKFVMSGEGRQLVVDIDPATGEPRARADIAPPPAEPDEPFGSGARFRLSTLRDRFSTPYTAVTEQDGTKYKVYLLPQTDRATWQRARPDKAKTYGNVELAEIAEEIGPHQVESGRLWFGKSFYDEEGATGVGGFGYFDPATVSYHLFAPPEIAAWSVSAILVEPDCVWLALYLRGEYGNYPGGLMRWDRNTSTVRRWDMAWIATSMERAGDTVYMGTTDGIAVLRGDRVVSYFVDRSSAGQFRMAARN
jgi:hypothetical protein